MNALVAALPRAFLEKRLDSLLTSWRSRFGEHPIAIELWNGKRFTLGESLGEGSTLVLRIQSPEAIGHLMLEDFLIAFEAASLLLLVAAVAAIVLAGRRRDEKKAMAQGEEAR